MDSRVIHLCTALHFWKLRVLRALWCPADGCSFPHASVPPLQANGRQARAGSLAGAKMVCNVYGYASDCAGGQHADVSHPPQGSSCNQDIAALWRLHLLFLALEGPRATPLPWTGPCSSQVVCVVCKWILPFEPTWHGCASLSAGCGIHHGCLFKVWLLHILWGQRLYGIGTNFIYVH